MGTGFAKKKKQAKEIQSQFSKFQEDMRGIEATGIAGNGLVEIILTGENEMKKIKIKPECVDPEDIDGLEDLIKVAYENARKKLEEKMPSFGMPGFGKVQV